MYSIAFFLSTQGQFARVRRFALAPGLLACNLLRRRLRLGRCITLPDLLAALRAGLRLDALAAIGAHAAIQRRGRGRRGEREEHQQQGQVTWILHGRILCPNRRREEGRA